jgi:hypothetical protein
MVDLLSPTSARHSLPKNWARVIGIDVEWNGIGRDLKNSGSKLTCRHSQRRERDWAEAFYDFAIT